MCHGVWVNSWRFHGLRLCLAEANNVFLFYLFYLFSFITLVFPLWFSHFCGNFNVFCSLWKGNSVPNSLFVHPHIDLQLKSLTFCSLVLVFTSLLFKHFTYINCCCFSRKRTKRLHIYYIQLYIYMSACVCVFIRYLCEIATILRALIDL